MIRSTPHYLAIVALHERGFSDDFQLDGKGILWVQQQIIFPGSEFSIIDYYLIHADHSRRRHTIILGVLLSTYHVKGILIYRISAWPLHRPGTPQQKITGIDFREDLRRNLVSPISNNLLLKSK